MGYKTKTAALFCHFRTVSRLNLGYEVCHLNLPSIIPVLNFCPLQYPDCVIAWLPKSSLNRHFLYLRATINHPFTHPSTHFCHRYTSLPPSPGAPGASQTHKHNHCQPQLFTTPVLCDVLFFYIFGRRLRTSLQQSPQQV